MLLSVRVCVCVCAEPRLHTALVSAAKVTRCIQWSLVFVLIWRGGIAFSTLMLLVG